MPEGPHLGIDERGGHRSRRHVDLGRRTVRRQQLFRSGDGRRCRTLPSDPQIRSRRKAGAGASAPGMLVFPHGIHVDRDGNVWVTDGQDNAPAPPPGRIGDARGRPHGSAAGRDERAPGLQVQPGRQAAADPRHAGRRCGTRLLLSAERRRRRRPNGDIFVAEGHGGANSRILKFTKDGTLISGHRQKGHRSGRVRSAARARFRFEGPAVRRRPQQQPHPDPRSGGQVHRRSGRSSAARAGSTSTRNDTIYVADSESGAVGQRTQPDGEARHRIGSIRTAR